MDTFFSMQRDKKNPSVPILFKLDTYQIKIRADCFWHTDCVARSKKKITNSGMPHIPEAAR
jgi:hypothetical protein